METAIKNPYAVKNVKSFMGREGMGYECSLYKDGKRVGTVTDTCDGGGILQMYLDKGEEDALYKYCNLLPSETSQIPLDPPPRVGEYKGKYESFTMDIDPNIFVGRMVDEFETTKRFKQQCKKKTVFMLKTDKKGAYWTMNSPFTPAIKARLVKEHGDNLKEIINERY